jgi:nicotinic acetylcholine receptor alpha-10
MMLLPAERHRVPNRLDVMCKFKGLVNFPFDDLKCSIEFGGWMLSGAYQGIELWGTGFDVKGDEDTSGTSYQQFEIKRVETSLRTLYYGAVGEGDPWPVVRYQLTLLRASDFYIHMLVWPTILLSVAAFSVFLITPDCGERLGYGMTIILAIEVMKVVIDAYVPSCGEMLWAEFFTMVNE